MPPLFRFDAHEDEHPILALPMAAGIRIFTGILTATDAEGNARPAADAAGLTVRGVCIGVPDRVQGRDIMADNTNGAAGAMQAAVKQSIFRFRNSAASPVTTAELGKLCMVEDETTVARTSNASIPAGVVLALEPGFVWLWIVHDPGQTGGITQTFSVD